MPIDSTSTDAQVWAAYDDNASYDLNASTSQAKAFIVACRILIRRLPEMMANSRGSVRNNPEQLQAEMDEAKVWLASNPDPNSPSGGGVGYFSLNNSRD